MQGLMIVIIFTVTLADFATTAKSIPGVLKFLPELMTGVVILIVLLKGLRHGLGLVAAKYWLVFGFMIIVILGGIATNDVGPGPMLAGMRYYLRGTCMFLLAAVAAFSEKEMRQQLKVILGLGLLQMPVAVYQRWVIFSEDRFSGDDVKGTLMDSGILSESLICIAIVLVAFFMRGQLRKWTAVPLFFAVLLPTMINETKATAILVPAGLFATLIASAAPGKRVRVVVGGLALLGAFAAVFLPVYELMNANSPYKSKSLVEFFTDEKQLSNYMVGKKEAGFGAKHLASRGAAISFPLRYLARDPAHLAFGLGLGNASHSNLGAAFTGTYNDLFNNFVVSAAAAFLLEIGVLGLAFVFLLYWLVFSDAFAVARLDSGMMGALAAGWVGVVAIMSLSIFYNTVHAYPFPSYLYWYFSGVIAARRVQLTLMNSQSVAESLPRGGAKRAEMFPGAIQEAPRSARNT